MLLSALVAVVAYSLSLLSIFPNRIAALVPRLLATTSPSLLQTNNTDGAPSIPPLTRLTASWCRPPDSDLDLFFSTFGGSVLSRGTVLSAVGTLREVLSDLMKEEGKDTACQRVDIRIASRAGVAVTIFDRTLAKRSWSELHDAVDVLLLCVYQKEVGTEMQGTLFEIEGKFRFASVVIQKAVKPPGEDGVVGEE
ncbi:MAG: hypothetical protein Q9220_002146 [cf. Caloplaca sp. 1 TL-2023]